MSDETVGNETQAQPEWMEPEPAASLARREDVPPQEPRRAQVAQIVRQLESGKAQAQERVMVRHSEEIGELVAALALAQGAFEDFQRTQEAEIDSKRTGVKYKYGYETLADVISATRKPLSENGLVVMQFPFPGSQTITLRTMLAHKSGQFIYNDLTVQLDGGLDPKSVGSGITYLMRYSRKAILGLSPEDEDDDGAAAAKLPQPAQRKSQQAAPPPPVAAQQEAQTPAAARTIGRIVALDGSDAAMRVRLDTGYQAATRDAELIKALRVHEKLKATVELIAEPSTDPARYAPKLIEIKVRKREAGA